MNVVIHICRNSKTNKLCFAKSKRHQLHLLKYQNLKTISFFCNNKKLMITLFKTKGSQPHFS